MYCYGRKKIICRICEREFKSILGLSNHIKPVHHISSKEYYNKFIKLSTGGRCLTCSESTRFVNFVVGYKKYCSNKCHNKDKRKLIDIRNKLIYEDKMRNETIVFECKICNHIIFNNKKGIGSHLKHKHGMTSQKYYDRYLLINIMDKRCKQCEMPTNFQSIKRGYTAHCSKSCSNKDEANRLARKNGINKKEVKERQSRNLSQRILDGTFNPFAKNYKRGYFFSNKNQKELYYRSSYELKAYQLLEQMNDVKNYITEPFKISYKDKNSITRNYLPDILITYSNDIKELVEIKPENLLKDEKVQMKIKSARTYCEDNNMSFNIWTEKFLKL